MASYHFRAQIIKRSKGRSAIAAAAYRAGQRLEDPDNGKVHDYSRKRGVSHCEILIPEGAAPWLADRQKLWANVHAIEKRRDSQLARELDIALPHELTAEQRRELLLKFIREQFVSRGMVADVCFHDPVPERGDSPQNFHAHVLLTLRKATKSGLHHTKTREWNSDQLLREWREIWCDRQNEALARYGHRARVDHRTLEAQQADARQRGDRGAALALDRKPEFHIGAKANKLARQGKSLRSKDREVGPPRRRHGGPPRHRKVRYSLIDQGARLLHNLNIVMANIERLNAHVKHYQRLSALFRHRRQYLDHAAFEQLLAEKRQKFALKQQKVRDQKAVIKAMTTPSHNAKHRKNRRNLAKLLVGDIERTLAALLSVREHTLGRRAHLGRKLDNPRSLFRPKRRSRTLLGELLR